MIMKIFKKSLSILLSLLMLTGALAVGMSVSAEESYSAGAVIEYGTYPQSRVEQTAALASAAEKAVWKSYGYYSGTGVYYDGNMSAGDFAEYADFVLDGVKYRAVRFSAYRPYLTGFGRFAENSYVDDNGYELNTVYYFRYEPIQWKVLDPDTGFVVSAKHIDARAFNNYLTKSGADFYGDSGCENFANDYDTSSIKTWLNADFYDTAFTADQKNNIAPDGSLGSVFLLSKDENTDYTLIISEPAGTAYAECQGLHNYPSNGGCFRWTRTPTDVSEFPYTVSDAGGFTTGDSANYSSFGVCPAMKLSTIKNDTAVSCSSDAHIPGAFGYFDEDSHKAVCQSCGEGVVAPHTWNEPEWDWTDPEKPTYSTSCPACGAEKSGEADYAWYDPHAVTLDSDAYIDYYARVTFGSQTYEGTYHRVFEGSMVTARKMAFNSYINGKKQEAAALALETDGQICAQAIADAQAQLDTLEYNADKSYEENCAAADGIISALADRLEEIRTVYNAVFVADDKIVEEVPYTIETQSITAPDVPKKEGYTGKWEDYTLVKNGITVNAVYSPVTPDDPDNPDNPDSPDFSGFKIKNYNSTLSVDYKSTVIFHTTMEAPEGYEIVWSNGTKGSECKLNNMTDKEYKVSAKMVNKTTGETEAETEEVTVTVNTGFFAKIIAFFRNLFGSLPTYEDFKKK